jgi:hypothetical protein
MANTMTKISTLTLSVDTQVISLTSIPNTYTDLILKADTRSSATGGSFNTVYVNFNADYSTLYSLTYLQGITGSTYSARTSSQGGAAAAVTATSSATSNIWSAIELYIPNYAGSNYKTSMVSVGGPTNTTVYEVWQASMLYRSTSAISSVQLDSFSSSIKFLAGSTFTLYGI